jgi:hypothetical protein
MRHTEEAQACTESPNGIHMSGDRNPLGVFQPNKARNTRARIGDPNGNGLPTWAQFGAAGSVVNFSDSTQTHMEVLPDPRDKIHAN